MVLPGVPVQFLEIDALRVEAADRDLVPNNQVGNLDTLQRLLQCFLVPMQLREYCAELEAKADFELELVDPHG